MCVGWLLSLTSSVCKVKFAAKLAGEKLEWMEMALDFLCNR